MHYRQTIQYIRPTKSTKLFLRYVHYNITLNFEVCHPRCVYKLISG